MKLARQPRPRSALLAALTAGLFFTLGPPASAQASVYDWPTYHRDNTRAGLDPYATPFTSLIKRWTSTSLGGTIYAAPLVVGNLVIVADEGNVITALNAGTGAIVWQRQVGQPVSLTNPPFLCGNINPLGITGTPVVDLNNGIVYALAFEQPANYYLVGLDLQYGFPRFAQKPVAPAGFNPYRQQQRPALTLANGNVYAAFGGYAGDCGTYHGWVVGIPVSGSGPQVVFRNDPAGSGANEAGFWATAGPSVDASGNLYITSGNAGNPASFDNGETIFELSPTLNLVDWWAPSVWSSLDASDTDLGSVGPALVGTSNTIVFQIGKSGWGYLLNAGSLSAAGHFGKEPFSGQVCAAATTQTAAFDQVFGGVAYADPYIYVPCPEGIVALKMASGPKFSIAWTSNPSFAAGPPIVAGGIVWSVDTNLGTLNGLDPATGVEKFGPILLGNTTRFATPAAGLGRVYVATGDQVMAFGQPRAERTTTMPRATMRAHGPTPPRVPSSTAGGRPSRPAIAVAAEPAARAPAPVQGDVAPAGQIGTQVFAVFRRLRQMW